MPAALTGRGTAVKWFAALKERPYPRVRFLYLADEDRS
jgi:hypothetical protein